MTTWLIAQVFLAASINPVGNIPTVKWKGKTNGYIVGASGGSFEVEGPTNLMLEIRADKGTTAVTLEITRDGTHVSKNELKLKKKGKGPKGFPNLAKLGVKVPAGKHTYLVKPSAMTAVLPTTSKKLPAKLAAAAEVEIAPPPAAPEPPPEAEPEPEVAAAAPPEAPAAPPEPETPAEPEPAAAAVEEIAAAAPAVAEPASPAASGNLNKALRVAVYDFELQGIEKNIGTVVTDSVLAEVRKLNGVSAIGMDEIRDMLSHEANKQYLGCESDESCLAEIAGALGVDNLVTGKLSEAAEGRVMLVRRIDQARAKIAGVFDKRLKAGSGQEFLLSVGPAVEDLFPDRALREGAKRGVPEEVALRLDPPPLPTWTFWTVAGVAVAAGAAGGVFGLLARTSQADYNEYVDLSTDQVIEGSVLKEKGDRVETNSLVANISFIAAGALALTAGVLYLFTDWEGYGAEATADVAE